MPMAKYLQTSMFDPYVAPAASDGSYQIIFRRRRYEWLILIGLTLIEGAKSWLL